MTPPYLMHEKRSMMISIGLLSPYPPPCVAGDDGQNPLSADSNDTSETFTIEYC